MQAKEKIQREATQAIINNNYNGLLISAMRTGKTKIIIDAIRSYVGSILWITDKAKLRDEAIPLEIEKWNLNRKIDIICYNSIKNINKKYDLIILDECQRLSESNYGVIKDKFNDLLACTGTKPNNYKKLELYEKLELKEIFNLSVDEASSNKIIADYDIDIHYHNLDSKNKNIKVEYKDKKTKENKVFYTTELARYNYISLRIEESNAADNKFLRLNRMRFIGTLPSKEYQVSKYLSENLHKKIIIFCITQDQADRLCYNSYHSKSNQDVLDHFKNNLINHISVVNKIDTGETFTDIDEIILVTSNSSNIQSVQRIGRSLMFREGYKAKIKIFCTKDTVEEQWIYKALVDLSNTKINKIYE